MAKGKGATADRKKKRIEALLDLMIKRRLSNHKLIEALKQHEPGISDKTAQRAITDARKILAGIGSQSSAEERGLLWERIDDLYATVQNTDKPDPHLLNQLLRTQLSIHQSNPNRRETQIHATKATEPTTLSPGLERALKRLGIPAPDAGPQNTS